MSDKFREDWEHPDHTIRYWYRDLGWIYNRRPRISQAEHQTKAEYDALMPKQGDVIEVRDHDDEYWSEREFLAFDGEKAVVRSGALCFLSWNQWRPIQPVDVDALKKAAYLTNGETK